MKLIFEVDVPGAKPTYPHDGPGSDDAIKRMAETVGRGIERIQILRSPDLYYMRAIDVYDDVDYRMIPLLARCIGVEL